VTHQFLSPAAQAVLDAVASQMEGGYISPDFIPYEARKIAAALRAIAEQSEYADVNIDVTVCVVRADHIYAIAAELEGQS